MIDTNFMKLHPHDCSEHEDTKKPSILTVDILTKCGQLEAGIRKELRPNSYHQSTGVG